ncbi:hypothetical protein KP509_18G013400 [Ceratopteris richardii]|uniref:Uncharacterized protein n=1 Tax=Ceratopteris richardii TaxID=49495 RepID=A0A8T2SQY3_CERRI|nr:hypothetical protein KP509_18G013400 [Ceratopteris richardii]
MGASKKWFKSIVNKKLPPPLKTSGNDATASKRLSPWSLLTACHVINKASILGEEDDDEDLEKDFSGRSNQAVVGQAEQEEWAAIRIQTAFRVVLARRALCALKGLARLKAAIDGQNGQKQSVRTQRSIQTFVRMQDGWCHEIGSIEEIQTRVQQKHEAAMKRERAMAYAFSNQWRANSKIKLESFFDYELDNSTWSWVWLDRWVNDINQKNANSTLNAGEEDGNQDGGDREGQDLTNSGKNVSLKKSASARTHKPCSSPKTNITSSRKSRAGTTELQRAKSVGATHGTFSTLRRPNQPSQKSSGMRSTSKTNTRQPLSGPNQGLPKDTKRISRSPSTQKSPSGKRAESNEAKGSAMPRQHSRRQEKGPDKLAQK